MLRDVVVVVVVVVWRTHAHTIHDASHVDREKMVAWVSISMHACGFVSVVITSYGAPL